MALALELDVHRYRFLRGMPSGRLSSEPDNVLSEFDEDRSSEDITSREEFDLRPFDEQHCLDDLRRLSVRCFLVELETLDAVPRLRFRLASERESSLPASTESEQFFGEDTAAFDDTWFEYIVAENAPFANLEEDILNWDNLLPTPPERPTGTIQVRLVQSGRDKPIPADNPWGD